MRYRLGLLAKDIHNSVTPKVYAAFGKDLDVDFHIYNVEPSELDETVTFLRNNLHGFNVTMPYKIKMLQYADETDESAELCSATNVMLVKEGKLIAYNTDGWGLIKALHLKGFDFAGKKVVMVGAGGVGLSIAYYLLKSGVGKADVLNIFPEETDRLCKRFGDRFTPHQLTDDELNDCCRGADCFINASVLGQVGYDDYENLGFLDNLNRDAVVFDVNYSNPDARLPAAAKNKGLRSYVGRAMTVCQGIRAMEIWTGFIPSDDAAEELIESLENHS